MSPRPPGLPLLLALFSAVGLASCACDDHKPARGPLDAGEDTGADAVDDADVASDADAAGDADVEPDAVVERWPEPPALAGEPLDGAIEVEAAGTRIVVERAPFALSLRDAGGIERARTWRGEEARFGALAVGHASPWSRLSYYEPTLTGARPTRDDIDWYAAQAVTAAVTRPDGGVAMLLTTADGEGVEGPWLVLELRPGPQGVDVTVQRPALDALVFTNLLLGAAEGEGYYGLGELFDRLDARGSIRELLTQASGMSESATNEVHVPIPAWFSTGGYGLFADDPYPMAFDFGVLHEEATRLTSLSPSLTVHLMAVDAPLDFTERYTALSGRPARVPFWALAPQYWRNENRDADEVLDDAARARAMDIPASVVWIDRPWSSYYHNWRFNPSQFPDSAAMLEGLRQQGLRVILHHSPQLNPPGQSDLGADEDASDMLYPEFAEAGWLVHSEGGQPVLLPWGGGMGAHIDWTHADAVARVQGLIQRVTDLGVLGTKMDWDEYIQPNVVSSRFYVYFSNGEDNLTMKSRYSALYHKAIIEGFDAGAGEPTFHISRTGAPGDQVWNTCIWPGDLDNDLSEHGPGLGDDGKLNVGGLPAAIIANQSLGLSGYPCFGSDIGGYRGGLSDEEVMQRWLAFGTFNAVMQLGGGGGSHMAWTADAEHGAEVLETTRRYFKLRMRLLPYIYHWLEAAHATGRPLVRSLYAEFPGEPEARLHERDFMFGPDLLVAPVYEPGATTRAVWLPPGAWIDLWTGELLAGGATVERPAPLDTIPVFIREGALIPMAPDGIDTVFDVEGDNADAITSWAEVRAAELHLYPAPEGERAATFANGLAVVVRADEAGVDIELGLGAVAPQHDPRWFFSPESIALTVELGARPFDPDTAALTVEREGQTTALPACPDAECWSFDAARRQLRVEVGGAGIIRVR